MAEAVEERPTPLCSCRPASVSARRVAPLARQRHTFGGADPDKRTAGAQNRQQRPGVAGTAMQDAAILCTGMIMHKEGTYPGHPDHRARLRNRTEQWHGLTCWVHCTTAAEHGTAPRSRCQQSQCSHRVKCCPARPAIRYRG